MLEKQASFKGICCFCADAGKRGVEDVAPYGVDTILPVGIDVLGCPSPGTTRRRE